MENHLVQSYITQLRELFAGEPWIEETFEKKLKKVTGEIAFKKPWETMHSVAELISHLTVWKREVLSRLKGEQATGLTMNSAANWKSNHELRQQNLFHLLKSFVEVQKQLLTFLENKPDDFLLKIDDEKNVTYDYYIRGLIQHDAYHLGQIGLVLKILLWEKDGTHS